MLEPVVLRGPRCTCCSAGGGVGGAAEAAGASPPPGGEGCAHATLAASVLAVASARRVLSYALPAGGGRPVLLASLAAPPRGSAAHARFAALALAPDGAALAVLLIAGGGGAAAGEQRRQADATVHPEDAPRRSPQQLPAVVIVCRPHDFTRLARVEVPRVLQHDRAQVVAGFEQDPFLFVGERTLLVAGMLLTFATNYDHVVRRVMLPPPFRIRDLGDGEQVYAEILHPLPLPSQEEPSATAEWFAVRSTRSLSIFARNAVNDVDNYSDFESVLEYSGSDIIMLATCGTYQHASAVQGDPLKVLVLIQRSAHVPLGDCPSGRVENDAQRNACDMLPLDRSTKPDQGGCRTLLDSRGENLSAPRISSSCETQPPSSPTLGKRNYPCTNQRASPAAGERYLEWAALSSRELSSVRRISEIEVELESSDFPLSCVSMANGNVLLTTRRAATYVLDPLSTPSIVARHHRPPVAGPPGQLSRAPLRHGIYFSSRTQDSSFSAGHLMSVSQMDAGIDCGHEIFVNLFPADHLRALPPRDESHQDSHPLRSSNPAPVVKTEQVTDARPSHPPPLEEDGAWNGVSRCVERPKVKTRTRKKRRSSRISLV